MPNFDMKAEHYREFTLPTTPEQYDELVDEIVSTFELENKDHASAVISVAIRRLPNDQSYTTMSYLLDCIIKSLANGVANYKSEMLSHSSQVQVLVNTIKSDPGDQQAIDNLQKAASEGSELAKNAMKDLFPDQAN